MATSLFNAYRLAPCFPKAVYESRNPLYAKFTVHFLIALDQPVATIVAYAAKHRDQLFIQSGEDKLTPLHLAVMKGKEDLVTALLNLKAPVDIEDAFGWTPLHHSALLINRVAIQALLKEKGAQTDKKTSMGMTAEEIAGFLEPDVPLCWSLQNLFYYNDEAELKKVTDVPKELGLKRYTDQLIYSVDELRVLWRMKKIPDGHQCVAMLVAQMKQEVQKHPPHLIVVEELERLYGGACRGLVAKEPINAGECIGIFSGKVKSVLPGEFQALVIAGSSCPQPLFECEEACAIVDNEESNALHFINDGFPNCAVDYSTPTERLLIAAEEIRPGDRIAMDYGIRRVDLKWGYCRFLRSREMEACFIQDSPEKMWAQVIQSGHGLVTMEASQFKVFKVKYLRNLMFGVRLRYVFHTPGAIVHLWAKNIVKPEVWFKLLSDEKLREQLLAVSSHQQHYWWMIKMVWCLGELDKKVPTGMRAEVQRFILEQMEVLSMTQIVKAFALILEHIEAGDALNQAIAEVQKQRVAKGEVIVQEAPSLKVSEAEESAEDLAQIEELLESSAELKAQLPFELSWPVLREHLRKTLPTYVWNEDTKPVLCTMEYGHGIVLIREGDERMSLLAKKFGLSQ